MKRAVLVNVIAGLSVTLAGARILAAQESSSAAVTGFVFDSVRQRPLVGAVVQLIRGTSPSASRSTRAARTDSTGRYLFDNVESGSYLMGFLHENLDSLHLEPKLALLEVEGSATLPVNLGIPSARSIVRSSCPAVDSAGGLLVGRARSALSRMPGEGAVVRVEWESFTFADRKLERRTRGGTVTAGADGAYALCGVPADGLIRVRAVHGAEASGVVTLLVPADGLLVRDVFVSGEVDTSIVGVPIPDDSVPVGAPARQRVSGAGTVRGRTVRAEGTPVPNVRVRFSGGGAEAVSNNEGYFALEGLPRGSHTLDLRALGFLPLIRTVDVLGDDPPRDYIMQTRAEYLDTVRVLAADVTRPDGLAGFDARRVRGFGHFITPDDITKRDPRAFTDLLRNLTGVTLLPERNGARVVMPGMGTLAYCAPAIFLNGIRASELDGTGLDALVNVQDLVAVEVYTRTGSMPPQFTTLNGCGSLVIWTKRPSAR